MAHNIDFSALTSMIDAASERVRDQMQLMNEATAAGENIDIPDMFKTQLLMNTLAQVSETATGVLSASNAALASMARNVKA